MTLDDAVAEHGLRPAVVKIDVEGGELDVLRGATRTLADAQPVLLVEVSEQSGRDVERLLRDYRAFRVERRRLVEGLAGGRGLFNAVFLP